MRFMVITKATAESEAGAPPATEDFETMGTFIQELVDAGVLLAADGLHPSAKGARIYFDGEQEDRGGRAVHRDQGAHRRLLPGRDEVARGVRRVVQALPDPAVGLGAQTNIEIRRVSQAEDFGEEFTAEQREAVDAAGREGRTEQRCAGRAVG